MLHWDEQTMSTCWFAVNNAMLHLNVSGPNNAKADYANWGYRGHCNVTMAPSWLSWAVCACVLPIPLGFSFFPPTDAFPKTPYPVLSVLRPHYRGCCQLEGQGSWQRISLINTPWPDQSTCLSASTNETPARIKRKEWEERECQNELDRVRKREIVNKPCFAEQIPEAAFFSQFGMTLSRTRTLMGGVRHHDAPVMPLGLFCVCSRPWDTLWEKYVDLWLNRDQFLLPSTNRVLRHSKKLQSKEKFIIRAENPVFFFHRITQTITAQDYKSTLPFNYESPNFIHPNYKTQQFSPHSLSSISPS